MAEGYFLDTSALFKRYKQEKGSEFIDELFKEENLLFISSVTLCEVISNLRRLVDVDGIITEKEFNLLRATFLGDVGDGRLDLIELTTAIIYKLIRLSCDFMKNARAGIFISKRISTSGRLHLPGVPGAKVCKREWATFVERKLAWASVPSGEGGNLREQHAGKIAFLISLLFFLIASNFLAQWYVYHRLGFDSHFRFEDGAHVKSDVLDLYVEYMARQKGYKIAVIGDSVVQGANVPERGQTITAHLEDELRGSYLPEARVFNFGLPGGRPADLFMAVKRLHQAGAAQLFVINISYPFFSDEMAKEPLLYYKVWRPQLTDEQKRELKVPPEEDPAEQGGNAASAEAAAGSEAEEFLQEKVAQYWAVYRFRQEINRFLFGGRPAEKGKEYFDLALGGGLPAAEAGGAAAAEPGQAAEQEPLPEKDRPENKYNVWHSFSWSDRDREHLRKVFNVTGSDNVDFKYYRELLRYLEENKVPAVIFMSPVNHALLQRYQLLDYGSYRRNTAVIEQEARRRGLAFFNYQEAVPPDLFHDSLHLLDGGNAATARLLSHDLQPCIQGVRAR